MTVLLAAMLLSWSEPTPDPWMDGYATYYSPGVMEAVAQYRGMSLDGHIGGVALNRAGDLGRRIYIEKDGAVYGPFLVCDMARQGVDYETREAKGFIVEVAYELAQEWGMRGPIPVRVHFTNPFPDPPNAT